jgi:hypothetical protein
VGGGVKIEPEDATHLLDASFNGSPRRLVERLAVLGIRMPVS